MLEVFFYLTFNLICAIICMSCLLAKERQMYPVLLQFTTPRALSPALVVFAEPRENPPSRGFQLIENDHSRTVSLIDFREMLEKNDLVLCDVTALLRFQDEQSQTKPSFVTRFHFFPSSMAEPAESIDEVAVVLDEITTLSFWHVIAFQNESAGSNWLSINAAARVQRFVGDNPDTPVGRRARDSEGKPTDKILPLEAHCRLHYHEGRLSLI